MADWMPLEPWLADDCCAAGCEKKCNQSAKVSMPRSSRNQECSYFLLLVMMAFICIIFMVEESCRNSENCVLMRSILVLLA